MIDRTQEDINQDRTIEAQAKRIAAIEQKQQDMLDLAGSHTSLLTQHETRLRELDPLRVLIEHIETIKSFFTSGHRQGKK